MHFSDEQVVSLAPDPASAKAAEKIYNKTSWQVYRSERGVWSALQGSGKSPYLTQLDLNDTAFKCTCPSRKFPCKHSLALAIYLAHYELDSIAMEEEPVWVSEWLNKRATKQNKTESPPTKQTKVKKDETTQERYQNALQGITFLQTWLEDSMKQGILNFPNKDEAAWEKITKIFIDRKIGGVNRYINALAAIAYDSSTWQEQVLHLFSKLHILVHYVKKYPTYPKEMQKEIEQVLSWSHTKQEIFDDPQTEVIDDIWVIIKVQTTVLERLTTRKVYLYGLKSDQWVYLLDHAYGGSFDTFFLEGHAMVAKLAFLPTLLKQRAFLKIKGVEHPFPKTLPMLENFAVANDCYMKKKMDFALFDQMPFGITMVQLVKVEQTFMLVDQQNMVIVLSNFDNKDYFKVLAHTQVERFDAFILRIDQTYTLMAFIVDGKLVTL